MIKVAVPLSPQHPADGPLRHDSTKIVCAEPRQQTEIERTPVIAESADNISTLSRTKVHLKSSISLGPLFCSHGVPSLPLGSHRKPRRAPSFRIQPLRRRYPQIHGYACTVSNAVCCLGTASDQATILRPMPESSERCYGPWLARRSRTLPPGRCRWNPKI